MPRPIRILFENAWYHIMNRGAGRKPIFHNDDQRTYFLDLLSQCNEFFNLEIHAYCLMDNHYHLLVKTPRSSLSDAMKFLGASYARKFNRECRTDGSLFRGRFKAIVLDADEYLVQVSRYIHRNPVEAKLVDKADQHPWSSFASYLNPLSAPPWLETATILQKVATKDHVEEYRRLVENEQYPSMNEFYSSRCVPGVLGSKAFRHYISGLGFPDVATEALSRKYIELDAIEKQIAKLFDFSPREIRQPSPGKANAGRMIALHLAEKWCGEPLTDIAACYGVKPTALRVMLSRFRAKAKTDEELAEQMRFAENAILEESE